MTPKCPKTPLFCLCFRGQEASHSICNFMWPKRQERHDVCQPATDLTLAEEGILLKGCIERSLIERNGWWPVERGKKRIA